jgi:hypothetical protein
MRFKVVFRIVLLSGAIHLCSCACIHNKPSQEPEPEPLPCIVPNIPLPVEETTLIPQQVVVTQDEVPLNTALPPGDSFTEKKQWIDKSGFMCFSVQSDHVWYVVSAECPAPKNIPAYSETDQVVETAGMGKLKILNWGPEVLVGLNDLRLIKDPGGDESIYPLYSGEYTLRYLTPDNNLITSLITIKPNETTEFYLP